MKQPLGAGWHFIHLCSVFVIVYHAFLCDGCDGLPNLYALKSWQTFQLGHEPEPRFLLKIDKNGRRLHMGLMIQLERCNPIGGFQSFPSRTSEVKKQSARRCPESPRMTKYLGLNPCQRWFGHRGTVKDLWESTKTWCISQNLMGSPF